MTSMKRARLHQIDSRIGQSRVAGFTILLFLTLIILALTTFLASEVSVNKRKLAVELNSVQRVSMAQEALLGYALSQTVPGTLPCPDTTGDGLENAAGLQCASQLGLLPLETLGLPPLTDGTGAALWYAVELNYVANAIGAKNSSRASALNVDGNPVAFIVIAAGRALDGQARRVLVQSDFLEGVNADTNLMNFSSLVSATQNDQVNGLSTGAFWSLIETRVLASAKLLLHDYRDACGEYPWAAPFGGPYVSASNQQGGSLPFTAALPFDWGTVCAAGITPTPPNWLQAHWQDQLYYRMCTSGQGNCLAVSGAASPATAVLLAPGITLAGQLRPNLNPAAYFEAANSNPPDTQFQTVKSINHSVNYNDVTQSVNP